MACLPLESLASDDSHDHSTCHEERRSSLGITRASDGWPPVAFGASTCMQTTPASASFISRVNLPACSNVKVQELPTTVAPLPLATLMLSHATGMDWVCFVCLSLMAYTKFDYGSVSFPPKTCFKLSSGSRLETKTYGLVLSKAYTTCSS
jgi:hypothetical protein